MLSHDKFIGSFGFRFTGTNRCKALLKLKVKLKSSSADHELPEGDVHQADHRCLL